MLNVASPPPAELTRAHCRFCLPPAWRVRLAALGTLLLAACGGLPIDTTHVSRGQDSRVQFVVLHYTSSDLPESLQMLTDQGVSSHYLIGATPPTIYRLVDEERRAWHAGESQWRGRTWLNASSIGIELVNPGYRQTAAGRVWYGYPQAQIDRLIALLQDIRQRHQLPIDSIVGHSDIAPQRKVDPGPLFPWRQLADAGLIRWPDAQQVARLQPGYATALPDALWFQQQLAASGYSIAFSGEFDEQTRNVLAAFQMKYRPARYDGVADAETAALLAALNAAGQP
ncbi:N-acetylmuramoyl-L-alanine amidase [Pseudomonas sp. N040]|uniref:N-acetylmuramoyl-L-alanine amidase n=1 Tax=Pseudomonas sp. N040 TaxID=2785325 RepID=UPI0018A311BE|nr:N-acetylmuramoyl-L-alanine amidase [Pseudomonas sp. N040]MBF7728809.1 N-acetylmuramoyl-L-alanine amidase [Pseudomonas sp. N040]MBW7012449.1 N-acetylmuramoyl-L-alanine amidase [Pseudomonas sp. N040]